MKKFVTYVIQSENKRKYIGHTDNLEKRLSQHNEGKSLWTKRYKNWKIIYKKEFNNRTNARKWENYLKKQKGGNGLIRIIKSVS